LKSQRGQALVEFALILPILLAVMIGIFQFGGAYSQKNNLNFLANQAARYASVNGCAPCAGTDANAIATYVKSTADTSQLKSTTTITFCLPNSTNKVGDPLQVTVSAPYKWLGVLSGSGLPTGVSAINSTVTTRILQAPDPTATPPSPALYTTTPC
jgi:Flp pilus assembly protein TadG